MKILVVCLRRIGDVLLATPLVRSLKATWPQARVDMLVFAGTTGILDGNADVDEVLALPDRPSRRDTWAMLRRVAGDYDLAISTQSGDRPAMFARVASRRAIGLRSQGRGGWLRDGLLTRSVPTDPRRHRVEEMLVLAEAAGATARVATPSGPQARLPDGVVLPSRYVVLHPGPAVRYKRWNADGWRRLVAACAERGLGVVVTGGPGRAEREYLDALFDGCPVLRLDGRLDWSRMRAVIEGAVALVGVDTSTTHLAAIVGVPTVAVFGPTDPRIWGPWPMGADRSPWVAVAHGQANGNVRLVQHAGFACQPCQQDGCDRHIDSRAACLDELDAQRVIDALDAVST